MNITFSKSFTIRMLTGMCYSHFSHSNKIKKPKQTTIRTVLKSNGKSIETVKK